MPVVKMLLHSVVSEYQRWMTIDIKDYITLILLSFVPSLYGFLVV